MKSALHPYKPNASIVVPLFSNAHLNKLDIHQLSAASNGVYSRRNRVTPQCVGVR
jgi:hypothetical protein